MLIAVPYLIFIIVSSSLFCCPSSMDIHNVDIVLSAMVFMSLLYAHPSLICLLDGQGDDTKGHTHQMILLY